MPAEEAGGRPDSVRLLIVDDHDLIRDGLRDLLGREPGFEIVGTAGSGREALEFCRRLRPDLVLMDVRMPEMDGLEATRVIKREHPGIHVLMVTMHDDPDYVLQAVKGGAAGYVLKDASREELIVAVRRALDGELPVDRNAATRLLRRLAGEALESSPGPDLTDPPTSREIEVVKLLASGWTDREISRRLGLDASAVRAHVRRVILKFEFSGR